MLRRSVVGGLVLFLIATAAQAQDRGRRMGFGGPGFFGASSSQLLGTPEVQKELGVTDEQKGLIEDMVADIREKMREAFAGGGGFQDFQNLSQEEQRKVMEEGRKKGEEVQKKADDMVAMILEPKQLELLQQLKLQREGVMALNRDEIAKKLAITDEQREKIRKIQEESRPQFSFQQLSEEERRELFAKMRERGEKMNADIIAVLTPEQKSNWEKMQGKKFEFPPPQFGRRPGGGN
jgi:Spy/CpxP family protein refolding chaperone